MKLPRQPALAVCRDKYDAVSAGILKGERKLHDDLLRASRAIRFDHLCHSKARYVLTRHIHQFLQNAPTPAVHASNAASEMCAGTFTLAKHHGSDDVSLSPVRSVKPPRYPSDLRSGDTRASAR